MKSVLGSSTESGGIHRRKESIGLTDSSHILTLQVINSVDHPYLHHPCLILFYLMKLAVISGGTREEMCMVEGRVSAEMKVFKRI